MRLSNHFKFLLLLLIFLFSSVYASETRRATMGGGGIFLKDQSNVFLFPGTLLQYPDLVVGEMRVKTNDAFYSLGMHLKYSDMVAGLYVNQPINSFILTTGQGSLTGTPGRATPVNEAYAYMLGMKLAGMDMGFGLLTASTAFENKVTPKTEQSASYFGVLAGASTDKMDLGLLFELPSVESKIPGGDTLDYSGFAIQANGRYNLMESNGYSLFPVGNVYFGSSGFKDTTEYTRTGFAVGIGIEKNINKDNTLVVGIEASLSSIVTDKPASLYKSGTVTTYTLPGLYVGIESRIASWLLGRVGATQVNQKIVTESKKKLSTHPTNPSDGTVTASQFALALGLGMEFGNFLLDFNMNEGLLFDGPYIFAGTGGGSPFATSLSITYNFAGGENE